MKERKQDRARFWKGIRMVWRMDRGLVVHSVLRALLQAAIPYVGILLSAYVLDGLQAAGLHPVDVYEKRGWVCILCRQNGG